SSPCWPNGSASGPKAGRSTPGRSPTTNPARPPTSMAPRPSPGSGSGSGCRRRPAGPSATDQPFCGSEMTPPASFPTHRTHPRAPAGGEDRRHHPVGIPPQVTVPDVHDLEVSRQLLLLAGVGPGVADRAVPAGGLDPVHEVGVGDVLEVDPGDEVVFGADLHLAAHPYPVALAQPLEAGLVARLGRSVVGRPLREYPAHDPDPVASPLRQHPE